MKSKILSNVLIGLCIVVVLVFVNLQLILSVLYPTPLQYTNLPFPTNQETYTKQDRFIMYASSCSEESVPVAVVSVKEIYNPLTGANTPLPSGSRIIAPGCTSVEVPYSHLFPDDLDDGTYYIRGVTTFRGRFRVVDVAWQTEPFVYRR